MDILTRILGVLLKGLLDGLVQYLQGVKHDADEQQLGAARAATASLEAGYDRIRAVELAIRKVDTSDRAAADDPNNLDRRP